MSLRKTEKSTSTLPRNIWSELKFSTQAGPQVNAQADNSMFWSASITAPLLYDQFNRPLLVSPDSGDTPPWWNSIATLDSTADLQGGITMYSTDVSTIGFATTYVSDLLVRGPQPKHGLQVTYTADAVVHDQSGSDLYVWAKSKERPALLSFPLKPEDHNYRMWFSSHVENLKLTEGSSASTSTAKDPFDEGTQLEQEISKRVLSAESEYFEDGMDSEFSRALHALVEEYGNRAVSIMTKRLVKADPEVLTEAIRSLSLVDHSSTYIARRWFIEAALQSEYTIVRDAAISSLWRLLDPHAVPFLLRACRRENVPELREDMEQLLQRLAERDAKAS